MKYYRISKYDPEKRKTLGWQYYLNGFDWSAISDIGTKPDWTYEAYEKAENAYVSTVNLILDDQKITELKIDLANLYDASKEKFYSKNIGRLQGLQIDYDKDIAPLKDGHVLAKSQIEKVVRLMLRETMDMMLEAPQLKIGFGYDFLMFVSCPELKEGVIGRIEEAGLFVEPLNSWPWDK